MPKELMDQAFVVVTECHLFLRLQLWKMSGRCQVPFLTMPLTNQNLRTFPLFILFLPTPHPQKQRTHTHTPPKRKRCNRNLAKCQDFRASSKKNHMLLMSASEWNCARILLNILRHLPSTIWSTFSNASSMFPCSSFFSGHRNELCFMASWIQEKNPQKTMLFISLPLVVFS